MSALHWLLMKCRIAKYYCSILQIQILQSARVRCRHLGLQGLLFKLLHVARPRQAQNSRHGHPRCTSVLGATSTSQ